MDHYIIIKKKKRDLLDLLFLYLKKHFKNEQRSKDAAAKKDLIQVEYIGKINNYYEDIYITPYNNTD